MCRKMCVWEKARPLRRSRARFPLLSPAVTSSPGAGEVFPQRGSQAINLDAKGLSAMRKIPAVLLALPLGELAKPEALTERAYAVALSAKGVKCNKKLSRRAAASAGSRRGSCRLPLRPLPVKMQCRSVRRRSGIALLKMIFPLNMARAQRKPF